MTLHFNQLRFICLLFSFIFLSLSKPLPLHATSPSTYEPNQIIVKLDPLVGDIQLINSAYGLVTSTQLLGNDDIFLLEALPGVDVTQVVGLLSNHPLVEYAELNYSPR